jgi:hypothetical protein
MDTEADCNVHSSLKITQRIRHDADKYRHVLCLDRQFEEQILAVPSVSSPSLTQGTRDDDTSKLVVWAGSSASSFFLEKNVPFFLQGNASIKLN